MSRDNLGSKETIVQQNCSIKNKRYDLVFTPHRQKIGSISQIDKPEKRQS